MKRASSPASSHPSAAAKPAPIAWPTARRPVWISDEELQSLPTDVRQEIVELIAATYGELVVEAESPLERAAGEEFMFMFWLTLSRSLWLRGHLANRPWLPPLPTEIDPAREISNYLQLSLAKQRVGDVLMRVKTWYWRWRREASAEAAALAGAMNGSAAQPGARPTRISQPAVAANGAASQPRLELSHNEAVPERAPPAAARDVGPGAPGAPGTRGEKNGDGAHDGTARRGEGASESRLAMA